MSDQVTRERFLALDKLTLAEIEAMFSDRRLMQHGRPVVEPMNQKTGTEYATVPGALFYELEDLLT